MSNNACDGDQDGVRHYLLTASQGSGEVMVTVDLRKGRHFDRLFDYHVKWDGLEPTINSWLIWDKEDTFLEGLLNFWIDGMPLKSIAGLAGMRPQDVTKKLRQKKEEYFERCRINHAEIEQSLRRNDPEYEYLTNQRTKVDNMCALLMGGDEIKDVLQQLANLGEAE